MIRAIGFMLIIASCSGLGYMLGTRYNMRVRELKLLKVSLQMLETEIAYANTPLPEAFENVEARSIPPIKDLFKAMSRNLNSRCCSSVGEAFYKAIEEVKGKVSLNSEDIEILKSFGYSMGNSDVDGQVKSFRMVIKQLDEQEIKAEELRGKNEKMYKNLGFLGGLAIVILLL